MNLNAGNFRTAITVHIICCFMHKQIITKEIAKVIQPQFKETDLDTLTIIVKRYHDQEPD